MVFIITTSRRDSKTQKPFSLEDPFGHDYINKINKIYNKYLIVIIK
jgi:hypothetical protein